MKFNKNIVTCFIIMMILCNNLVHLKKSHHRSKRTKTVTKSKTQLSFNEIMNLIDQLYNKAKSNLIYFVLGILGEFISGLDTIFNEFIKLDKDTKVAKNFEACFAKFKKVSAGPISNDPMTALEGKTRTPAENKTYCKNLKENILDVYIMAEKEEYEKNHGFWDAITPDWASKATYWVGGKLANDVKFCNCPAKSTAPKTKAYITKRYNSMAEYKKQCLEFNSKDCDTYDPKTAGVKSFATNAYSYAKGMVEVGSCMKDLLNSGTDPNIIKAKNIIGKYFTGGSFIDDAMGAIFGAVMHVMTFGIWGGVKGAYYIVKLIQKIADFRKSTNDAQTMYDLGKIVGNAFLIVKSLIVGRRRFYKRKFK